MVPKHYFRVICCPKCKSDLEANSKNEENLVCSNCRSTYPVIDGVPVLLNKVEDEVSRVIKKFYDSAWKRNENDILIARTEHEDLSKLGQRYIQLNEDRFMPFFRKEQESQDFFLDAASGAQPRVSFGENYSYHICLDFSLDGLIECRKLLGKRAICICGSLLNIPIKDSVCNGIIASHCLYHIDKELQQSAISELSRVLHPQGRMLIFYTNPNSLEYQIVPRLKKMVGREERIDTTVFYYYAHPLSHMLEILSSKFNDSNIAVKPLRMFTKTISEPVFKNRILGHLFFSVFIFIERLFRENANLTSYVVYMIKNLQNQKNKR